MDIERRFVNLYPTRYEAFDNPGVLCIFRPDEDGGYWWCRRDGENGGRKDHGLSVLGIEAAVWWSGKDNQGYVEVSKGKRGCVVRANYGHLGRVAEVHDFDRALDLAAAFAAACVRGDADPLDLIREGA